jgi:hypothetical protein
VSAIRPLRDETRSAFARELLESASADRSAAGARDRALAALGIGAAGVLTAGTAAGAGAGVAAEAAASGGALGAGSMAPVAIVKVSALVVAKWVGVGMLGGAVALGSAEYVQRAAARPPASMLEQAPQPETPAAPLATTRGAGELETAPPEAPSLGAGDLETAPAPREARRLSESVPRANEPQVAEPIAGVPTPSGLAPAGPGTMQQLAALRAIRLLLASRDPARALASLDEFDRLHPSTPLREEVAVLRIDALSDLGRAGEAAALAAAFLRANPDSAYTRRVRSKLKVP